MKEKRFDQNQNNEALVPSVFLEAFPDGFNPSESLSSKEDFEDLFTQIDKIFAARIRRRLFFERIC